MSWTRFLNEDGPIAEKAGRAPLGTRRRCRSSEANMATRWRSDRSVLTRLTSKVSRTLPCGLRASDSRSASRFRRRGRPRRRARRRTPPTLRCGRRRNDGIGRRRGHGIARGGVSFPWTGASRPEDLLEKVDQAVCRSKEQGRTRLLMHLDVHHAPQSACHHRASTQRRTLTHNEKF